MEGALSHGRGVCEDKLQGDKTQTDTPAESSHKHERRLHAASPELFRDSPPLLPREGLVLEQNQPLGKQSKEGTCLVNFGAELERDSPLLQELLSPRSPPPPACPGFPEDEHLIAFVCVVSPLSLSLAGAAAPALPPRRPAQARFLDNTRRLQTPRLCEVQRTSLSPKALNGEFIRGEQDSEAPVILLGLS